MANLALVACTEDLCDVGGRDGIIEVEGEEVAGFLRARMQVCGHCASKAVMPLTMRMMRDQLFSVEERDQGRVVRVEVSSMRLPSTVPDR